MQYLNLSLTSLSDLPLRSSVRFLTPSAFQVFLDPPSPRGGYPAGRMAENLHAEAKPHISLRDKPNRQDAKERIT